MFQFNRPGLIDRSSADQAPNRWDWALLPLILGIVLAIALAASGMARPFSIGSPTEISLSPTYLPYYLARTTLRMLIAMACSLLFTFGFAYVASKYRAAEKIMLPTLDILQSLPILGFQAIAVAPFIALFPGNLLGVECAAIFAIFTSQAWNMAFSLHQSLRTVPSELAEAARIFRLSGWQRFWRLELPYGMPGLLWNMMMSMSGGWFFIVAAEAISVANQDIKLPGIGSYIAVAIEQTNIPAMGWAILAMVCGILLYDQLMFRPLLAWADKFRFEESQSDTAQQSWMLDWLRRSNWVNRFTESMWQQGERSLSWFRRNYDGTSIRARQKPMDPRIERAWDAIIAAAVMIAVWQLIRFIHSEVGWAEVGHVFSLGLATLTRVLLLMVAASLFWVPISVWVGLRPQWAQRVQAWAQLVAAFPANLVFPAAAILILRWHLNPNIWLSPLIVFGTQWYIVFNVVGGASTIPTELRYVADNFGLKGWLRWKRYLLPAVFPSFVTGMITASGGSWNASIVAELVTWGDTKLQAYGVGAYIADMTAKGDFPRIALGMSVMSLFVIVMNRFVWHRLYRRAEEWAR
ncbi:MAG: ABC transporter permease subunit [Burkholderiales bacterium]|nr:ABC transporter permease subunit [Burkholderiales bacterium]